MRHVPTLRWTIGIVAASGCCVFAAGHGMAPFGLMFVLGLLGMAESPPLVVLACALLLALPIAQRMQSRVFHAAGLAGLGALWGIAYAYSEARGILVVTSTLFLFLLAVQLRDVAFGVEEDEEPPRLSS